MFFRKNRVPPPSIASKLALAFVLTGLLSASTCKKTTPRQHPTPGATLTKGADISWVTEMEAAGIKFYNNSGNPTDCFALMKALGLDAIRLRVWVNPSPAWNSVGDVVAKAQRAHQQGLKLMIDFHYSDSWADPGKQNKPAAWAPLDFQGLKNALETHTKDVLTQLKTAGLAPEWVQIGNEINDGMLWPDGKASANMPNLALLINTGYEAAKSIFPNTKVMVHLSDGWNNTLYRWFFSNLKAAGGKWDVIGMSVYPTWYKTPGDWLACNTDLLQNMNDMAATYNSEVMVAEAGYPWDRASESRLFLQDLITKVKQVKGQKGTGVFYWEPESYNNWKGYTLGAFDNLGKPTLAMEAFK